jgi:vitamin B12 transporter
MLLRVDGINVSDPSASQIAPEVEHLMLGGIDRIEILRGSQSSLYGGQAVAGVIEITTLKPEPGTHHSVALEAGSFDTYRGQWSTGVSDARGDVRVYLEHLETAGFSAADENAGNTEKDGYRNTTLGARGRYALTDQLLFKGFASWTDRRIEFDGFEFGVGPVDEDSNKTDGEHLGLALGLQMNDEAEKTVHDLTLSLYQTDRETFGLFPASFSGARMEADYVGNASWPDRVDWLFGVNALEETSETASGDTKDNQITGAFLQAGMRPVDLLYITATGRVDEHSEFGTHATWRATAAYTPRPQTKLRTSMGTGFRAPSLFELFDSQLGNPDLSPETSTSLDAGVDHGFWDDRGLLSFTAFSLITEDQIEYVFPTGYGQVEGKSEREGLELACVVALTDAVQARLAYTHMLKAENASGDPLLRVPEQDVSVNLSYQVEDWRLYLRTAYVSGVEDLNYAPAGPPVAELDAYTVVDVGASYQQNDRLIWQVRIGNLLDEQYQQVRGYGTADRSVFAGLTYTL